LPSSGDRSLGDGSLGNQGNYGYLWSSSIKDHRSSFIYYSGFADFFYGNRATGLSVRCIKD
jgi:hypothetical protein